MAPRPVAERPPSGLNSYWTHTWDHALSTLKAQGTWAWELKPLLDEYVFALRAAEATRDGFAWLAHLEEIEELSDAAWKTLGQIAGGLPTAWDRHTKRAAALADQLALTPRGRKAAGLHADDEPAEDDFSELDELQPLREARGA